MAISDVSVIDELPPGRKPIRTLHYFENKRVLVYELMKEIEPDIRFISFIRLFRNPEKLDYKNLEEGYEHIVQVFPQPKYHVGIVHGRMKATEKDEEMMRFKTGKTQILVATTVIEVGVDVPNASVMIIESSERFGLSQLHRSCVAG